VIELPEGKVAMDTEKSSLSSCIVAVVKVKSPVTSWDFRTTEPASSALSGDDAVIVFPCEPMFSHTVVELFLGRLSLVVFFCFGEDRCSVFWICSVPLSPFGENSWQVSIGTGEVFVPISLVVLSMVGFSLSFISWH